MVKKIFTLVLLIACSINFIKGQEFEYIVEKVDDVPSYYYCEKYSSLLSNLTSSNLMIQIMNTRGDVIHADVYFLNGLHNEDTIWVSTDSTGVAYIPKKKIAKGMFFVPPKGDLYNGIKGFVNDVGSTKKLTIILGQQSLSKMIIKSKSTLSSRDIQQIVDSVRKSDCIPHYNGVTIDFNIEI